MAPTRRFRPRLMSTTPGRLALIQSAASDAAIAQVKRDIATREQRIDERLGMTQTEARMIPFDAHVIPYTPEDTAMAIAIMRAIGEGLELLGAHALNRAPAQAPESVSDGFGSPLGE